jgi:hypothetical protein
MVGLAQLRPGGVRGGTWAAADWAARLGMDYGSTRHGLDKDRALARSSTKKVRWLSHGVAPTDHSDGQIL